ncbi:MAG: glutamine-hydrolyzing carbamoyl-phosphate synthase small subunit [Bdellovibrionales bacterium]|nr:glutamine-hydrolyzing carbamoyl-phosphate synthase small subunit [Bdellovibrionales bacterium]
MSKKGYVVIENGPLFPGLWEGGENRAGEVVFNTSHFGYEEMATDPSYMNQILVTTAPMQGNYGISDEVWESERLWINGFICLEAQSSQRDRSWRERLQENNVPLLTEVDTRKLVLYLRDQGTPWGAVVQADSDEEARKVAQSLIEKVKQEDRDWVFQVTCRTPYEVEGDHPAGPRVAVLDLGSKKNIVRELKKRCRGLKVFPSRTTAQEIRSWEPDGILLSNGPGDPADVEVAAETVRELLGYRPIFGICMGHHILSLALGGKTYKLRFGHRGSNHPVDDRLLDRIYVTSQNHGYAVEQSSLPNDVKITHTNLNDQTVSGIMLEDKKCFSVQFHPESHPGPHDAEGLFDYFVKLIQ